MVTIRSPALQQALDSQNPHSVDQSKKKKNKKKKTVPGQRPKEEWNLGEFLSVHHVEQTSTKRFQSATFFVQKLRKLRLWSDLLKLLDRN